MERKKIMTWMLTWLNVSAAALNATFQFLVIYRYWLLVSVYSALFIWGQATIFQAAFENITKVFLTPLTPFIIFKKYNQNSNFSPQL